jgi:hypothetical protein
MRQAAGGSVGGEIDPNLGGAQTAPELKSIVPSRDNRDLGERAATIFVDIEVKGSIVELLAGYASSLVPAGSVTMKLEIRRSIG